jgi:hypothetical protein
LIAIFLRFTAWPNICEREDDTHVAGCDGLSLERKPRHEESYVIDADKYKACVLTADRSMASATR